MILTDKDLQKEFEKSVYGTLNLDKDKLGVYVDPKTMVIYTWFRFGYNLGVKQC